MSYPPDKPPPCSGAWPDEPKVYRTGCPQNKRSQDTDYPRLQNTTLVPNPLCTPECGTDPCDPPLEDLVPPEPRDAVPENPWEGTDCGGAGGRPRGPWPDDVLAALAAENPDTLNTYAEYDPVQYADFRQCRFLGAARVYGLKNHHGTFGFGSHMRTGYQAAIDPDCGGACLANAWFLTAETTRYLRCDGTFYSKHDFGGGSVFESTVIRSAEVDRYSGKRTFGGSDDAGDGPTFDEAVGMIGFQDYQRASLYNAFCIQYNIFVTGGYSLTGPATQSAPDQVTIQLVNGPVTVDMSVDVSGGTFNWHQYDGSVIDVTESVTITDDHFEYFFDELIAGTENKRTAVIDLSVPYTGDDVHDDVDEMIDFWRFCDTAQMEYDQSDRCHGGPLVSRNERISTPPTLQVDVGATDTSLPPRAAQTDGAIIGLPTTTGSDPYFDFYAVSWDGNPDFAPETWGRYSPFRHATQWFDEEESPYYLFPGKYLPNGPGQWFGRGALPNPDIPDPLTPLLGDQLLKCEWSEVLLGSKPSHNWERPCGPNDVAEHDPDTVDCETNPDGDQRWPNTPCTCSGSYVAITDATNATPIVVTAPGSSATEGGAIIICGVEGNTAANITGVSKNIAGATFELYEADGITPVAGNGVYVADTGAAGVDEPDNFWNWEGRRGTFVLKTHLFNHREFEESWIGIQAAAAYEAVGTCYDTLTAPDPFHYTVNYVDDLPDSRSVGSGPLYEMTCEERCAVFSPCNPVLALITHAAYSPGDCPASAVQCVMPRLTLDPDYPCYMTMRFEQWMRDPLWKAPGRNYLDLLCDEDCDRLEEDDGSCKDDYVDEDLNFVCIYPMRRWEEAVCSVPDGAPAQPGDSYQVGCIFYVENRDDAIANPPECDPWFYINYADGTRVDADCFAPWAILLRQEICVRDHGRFWEEYFDDGTQAAAPEPEAEP